MYLYQMFQEWDEHNEPVILAEGPWELSFTRRYPDTTREISAKGKTFTDSTGSEYTISSLTISALGVYVSFSSDSLPSQPEGSITRKDGSTAALGDYHLSGSGHQNTLQFYYKDESGSEITILSPDEIASITLCDTTIPVN